MNSEIPGLEYEFYLFYYPSKLSKGADATPKGSAQNWKTPFLFEISDIFEIVRLNMKISVCGVYRGNPLPLSNR